MLDKKKEPSIEKANTYDVAIIGTGIAGSVLGAILARQGVRVILFEASSHPKFAIGESMILESSEALRILVKMFDVPELEYFSSKNYFSYIGTSHGVKKHFGFAHHRENQEHDKEDVLQAVIPEEPYGHELHIYRQDSDYYFMSIAIKYGAKVLQNTPIGDIEIDQERVTLTTNKGVKFAAKYVVDSGGFRSLLADKYNLRDFDLQTQSRSIFTHMVNMPSFHQDGPSQKECRLPHSMFEGTLHHLFHGGWIWVIPFNNHKISTNPLCSVGLMLDPRIHPKREDVSPETEFYDFINRFPSIAKHFEKGKPVREWVRTDRIQYSSKQVVGDRFSLLGHAAGFIDPLFSRGLYSTFACVTVLADKLIHAQSTQDYSRAAFQSVEELTLRFIKTNDRLIANAYKSFMDQQLWILLSINWILGAYLELLKLGEGRILYSFTQKKEVLNIYDRVGLSMLGGKFAEYEILSDSVYQIIENLPENDTEKLAEAISKIRDLFEEAIWIPTSIINLMYDVKYLNPRLKNFIDVWKNRKEGVTGKYWQYFFGQVPLNFLLQHIFKDKIIYSTSFLNWKKKARYVS